MIERWLSTWFTVEEINGHDRCPTYLFRWTVWHPSWGRGFGVYLHKFVADDWSLDLHDHPKRFISIGLKGRYREETPANPPRHTRLGDRLGLFRLFAEYRAPWVRTFPASHIHRISLIDGQPCWTLVIVLMHVRQWGFWNRGIWYHWRTYVHGEARVLADQQKACP